MANFIQLFNFYRLRSIIKKNGCQAVFGLLKKSTNIKASTLVLTLMKRKQMCTYSAGSSWSYKGITASISSWQGLHR